MVPTAPTANVGGERSLHCTTYAFTEREASARCDGGIELHCDVFLEQTEAIWGPWGRISAHRELREVQHCCESLVLHNLPRVESAVKNRKMSDAVAAMFPIVQPFKELASLRSTKSPSRVGRVVLPLVELAQCAEPFGVRKKE